MSDELKNLISGVTVEFFGTYCLAVRVIVAVDRARGGQILKRLPR